MSICQNCLMVFLLIDRLLDKCKILLNGINGYSLLAQSLYWFVAMTIS